MGREARIKPEIMSPAGGWPQLQAAVEAGADAVYFGLRHFSARAKTGFPLGELAEVMRTLHRRGVRGCVTFNTIVFEHELEAAAQTFAAIAEAGADAAIVQDLGMVRLAREIAPEMRLHASTQMSVTDAAGVRLAQRFGISRLTLARELSLDQVRAVATETDCELEIFIHGALCVAYSGQCFSSEAWGGRSANRGQCAQACRLPYELLVDGRVTPLGDARYLLSPGDLYTLRQIPEIVETGVTALKIEGRYKDADYVALTTRAYRRAVDEAWAGRALSATRAEELQLEQVFSRGMGPHFLTGTNHAAVVRGRAPRHRGVWMGSVVRVERDSVTIETGEAHQTAPLKAGDGVVFDAADWRSPEEPEEGGRVYQALPAADGRLDLRFGNGEVVFPRIRPGDLVWRTHDPDLARIVGSAAKQAVQVRVTAEEGAPLVADWRLARRPEVRVSIHTPQPLGTARNRAISAEFVREQMGRLGNTPYELAELELDVKGSPFVPASVLNHVRREAVEGLQAIQERRREIQVNDPIATVSAARAKLVVQDAAAARAGLHLLVRTPEQLDAALEAAPDSITLDYLDLYGLRPSVERIRSRGLAARVASPRVLKPGEQGIVDFLLGLECAILVRSAGLLEALRGREHPSLVGDFSLNAANSLAADVYFGLGVERLTPTHDLNAEQVAELARAAGAERFEAVAYQHLPVFYTEHCVFCRFLSNGTTYQDCGRPCETRRVALRDAAGRAHPVLADVGCRNTVFAAEAQEASRHLAAWLRTGIRHFRLEFTGESGEELRGVTAAFRRALDGELPAAQLASVLRGIAPGGTTEGSLFIAKDYRALPALG
jgi:putative protease